MCPNSGPSKAHKFHYRQPLFVDKTLFKPNTLKYFNTMDATVIKKNFLFFC